MFIKTGASRFHSFFASGSRYFGQGSDTVGGTGSNSFNGRFPGLPSSRLRAVGFGLRPVFAIVHHPIHSQSGLSGSACLIYHFTIRKLHSIPQHIYILAFATLKVDEPVHNHRSISFVQLHHFADAICLFTGYATASCCFNLMILKNYYDAIPNELIEAASIDGASKLRTCVTVVMPVAKPGLAVVLMQTFLSSWNEVLMARIFISDTTKQPLSVVPIRFAQSVSARGFTVEVMFAALVICLAPIVVFYIFAARSLISGLTAGAVKG